MTAVEVRVAVGDLDDQPSAPEPRQTVVAGDDVRLDRAVDQREPVLELRLPELLAPLDEVVAAPDVVDEDVELADLLEEAATSAGTVWSTRTAIPCPPRAVTSSAVSLDGLRPVLHPRAVRARCGPCSRRWRRPHPSAVAMPRPAPRVAPATTAIFPASGLSMRSSGLRAWVCRPDTHVGSAPPL